MIIKVPIYVEIDAIGTAILPDLVDDLGDIFYNILRKQKLNKTDIINHNQGWKDTVPNAKIISKEKALEHLRKGIK
jgi:hypothetical protein